MWNSIAFSRIPSHLRHSLPPSTGQGMAGIASGLSSRTSYDAREGPRGSARGGCQQTRAVALDKPLALRRDRPDSRCSVKPRVTEMAYIVIHRRPSGEQLARHRAKIQRRFRFRSGRRDRQDLGRVDRLPRRSRRPRSGPQGNRGTYGRARRPCQRLVATVGGRGL